MIIFIDATNIGKGGGYTHLYEILNSNSFKESDLLIYVMAQKLILDKLPKKTNIKFLESNLLEKTLLHRLYFQIFKIDNYIPKDSIVFSITGDYLGSHKPVVSMSRNMLLYEREIWKDINSRKEVFRFWINYLKQKYCFKNSIGIIFISKYAKKIISKTLNLENKNLSIIHHGLSNKFTGKLKINKNIKYFSKTKPYVLLYISSIHEYKHQWNVVEAVSNLRNKGYNLQLNLVGDVIFKPALDKLNNSIQLFDSNSEFVRLFNNIQYKDIEHFYNSANGIVYASTCENMPNILIESMASGIPIACSNKLPMPEFIKSNGFLFDSKNINSIEDAIFQMVNNENLSLHYSKANLKESLKYDWEKTAKQTINFLKLNKK